jgi:hypothetical protein
MNIFSINSLLLFVIFFVPGFVSIKIHDLLIASENRNFSESMLEVIAYSAINLPFILLLLWPLLYYKFYEFHPIFFSFVVFFNLLIFPVALPIVYIKLINQSWLAKNIISPVKRPWDWFFSKKQSFWVIVTLKDGRKIGGVFSNKSYASSFPAPEQIYLEQTWRLDEENHFLEVVKRTRGVIILSSDISTLEFFSE